MQGASLLLRKLCRCSAHTFHLTASLPSDSKSCAILEPVRRPKIIAYHSKPYQYARSRSIHFPSWLTSTYTRLPSEPALMILEMVASNSKVIGLGTIWATNFGCCLDTSNISFASFALFACSNAVHTSPRSILRLLRSMTRCLRQENREQGWWKMQLSNLSEGIVDVHSSNLSKSVC